MSDRAWNSLKPVSAEDEVAEIMRLANEALTAAFLAGQHDGMRSYGALPDVDADRRQVDTQAAFEAAVRKLTGIAKENPVDSLPPTVAR